jgi:subtilisin family serine protease
MKRLHVLTVILLSVLLMAGCTQKESILPSDEDMATLKSASVNSSYIVVLKKDSELAKSDLKTRETGVKAKAYGLLKKYDITAEPDYVYETALQGFAVKMAPGQAKKMELDNAVSYIEADQIITLSPEKITGKPTEGTSTQPAQQTPWGITRVGGISSYTGSGVAWIIDTGVDLTHPDLNVGSGVSFVPRVTSPNDDNGHGTHVAGTIAAINNTIGVVGVAPGAKVIPVKVLDKKGSGTTSGVISGINYVAANGKSGDVANMSLGGGVSTALDEAVLSASSVVKFALAAGNESDDANNHSPARVNGPNIYTVSAMDSSDKWAYFSNYGNPPIDYCAPGVSIYSTYKSGGYATLSGTSMATPHVAGLLLLGNLTTSGYVSGDPDNKPDPIAHH